MLKEGTHQQERPPYRAGALSCLVEIRPGASRSRFVQRPVGCSRVCERRCQGKGHRPRLRSGACSLFRVYFPSHLAKFGAAPDTASLPWANVQQIKQKNKPSPLVLYQGEPRLRLGVSGFSKIKLRHQPQFLCFLRVGTWLWCTNLVVNIKSMQNPDCANDAKKT